MELNGKKYPDIKMPMNDVMVFNNIIQDSVKAKCSHNHPSPATLKSINKQAVTNKAVELTMQQIQKDIEKLTKSFDGFSESVSQQIKELVDCVSKKDEQYNDKFATKTEMTSAIKNLKSILMPSHKLVFEILKWLAVVGASVLAGRQLL